MEKIHIIQDFVVPKERVFDFFSDHERWAEIYPGAFKRVVNSTDPTNVNGIGSVRRITNFPIIFEETITKYQPYELIEYRITEGAMPIKYHLGTMKFYDLDNGAKSRLDYTIEIRTRFPLTGFIIKNILENVIGRGVRNLSKKFKADSRF
ncbi:MAG: SRPBCC family protein [Chitinophagales bacterium]